ncbi:TPA: hypothetical protein NPN81_001673, partial [Klebsiella quasipneumoniae subsp. similipneumoniae]|nr:hypothetical protein [Klebsiella quasipneumoniae subsp. similipneumoniae]
VKLEFLILVKNNDTFCNSKKSFIEFLGVDSLISINGQNLSYKKSNNSKPLITVKFSVETNNIPSNKERYFVITLENNDEALVDEFSEVGDKIKEISRRINPESTIINVLWDDVGRYYANKAYPLINEVENVMRKLIGKFMLINVGMDWSRETINTNLAEKIKKFDGDDRYLNDLHKLDFIHLSEVLFKNKRDITLEELDRIISKQKIDESDIAKIKKYIPTSNWEKYFSSLIETKSGELEEKWERLYKLRNKVAHNIFISKQDFCQMKRLAGDVKSVLDAATSKLNEISLEEEERNQIIHSYKSNNAYAVYDLAEKAVANYYIKKGVDVSFPDLINFGEGTDLIIMESDRVVAVEIKVIVYRNPSRIIHVMKMASRQLESYMSRENLEYGQIVGVLHSTSNGLYHISSESMCLLRESMDPRISIMFGIINDGNEFEVIDL